MILKEQILLELLRTMKIILASGNIILLKVILNLNSFRRKLLLLNCVLYKSFFALFRFVPRTTEKDYIDIVRGQGCHSLVGKSPRGGKQELSLGDYCANSTGTPIHELMHALG